MLYMQEVEKLEGYGQESYQAKVGLQHPPYSSALSKPFRTKLFGWCNVGKNKHLSVYFDSFFDQDNTGIDVTLGSCLDGIFVKYKNGRSPLLYR